MAPPRISQRTRPKQLRATRPGIQEDRRIREILRHFEPVVDCIADVLGPSCEVVLHDVRKPMRSVTKIRNGHVTGRTLGSPLTDLGMEILSRKRFARETLGNYRVRTDDGRVLNSNAAMIRDDGGKIVGMLCINWDVTPLLGFRHLFALNGSRHKFPRIDYTEHHAKDLPTLIRTMIVDAMRQTGNRETSKKNERLALVRTLYRRGIFNARGCVNMVARALGVSNVCVYKYLEEIRHS